MTNERFREIMSTSFTDCMIRPTVERMDLKECLNAMRTVEDAETRSLLLMCMGYCVMGLIASVLFGWIWLMDYIGWFPYVPFGEEMLVPVAMFSPICIAYGFILLTTHTKNIIRRRIREIAESGGEE